MASGQQADIRGLGDSITDLVANLATAGGTLTIYTITGATIPADAQATIEVGRDFISVRGHGGTIFTTVPFAGIDRINLNAPSMRIKVPR